MVVERRGERNPNQMSDVHEDPRRARAVLTSLRKANTSFSLMPSAEAAAQRRRSSMRTAITERAETCGRAAHLPSSRKMTRPRCDQPGRAWIVTALAVARQFLLLNLHQVVVASPQRARGPEQSDASRRLDEEEEEPACTRRCSRWPAFPCLQACRRTDSAHGGRDIDDAPPC